MSMHCKKRNLKLKVFLVIFLLFIPLRLFASINPWLLQEYEQKIVGTLLRIDEKHLYIEKDQEEYLYVLDNNILSALMGKYRGQLLNPIDYPTGVEIELYINKENRVRAMRNKQMPIKSNEGILLDVWGHDISLSLDEKYFSIFNIESGLQLYPTSSNLINSSSPVPSLSSQSVSAWNNKGELLVASSNDLLIFEPERGHVSTISLPLQKNKNCSRIITSLEWNNKSDRIVYTVLEDFPDTESSIFELSIIDRNGSHIASKLVSNLGSTVWLSNELILYLTYNNIEENQGKMRLWNYKTNKTTEFLPCDKYYYRFAYNPRLEQLVFTQANGIGETLFLLNMNTGITRELITLPYTIRNLQWSNYGTLFFWDEYNNCIFQLVNLDQSTPNTLDNKECSVIPFATGYLPTNCVRNNVLFFLAEPQEEPMQPIFTKDQADN